MPLNRRMHIFTHEILHCTSQTFISGRDKQIGLLGWNPGFSGACFVASLCVALSAASTTIVCLVIFLFAINVMMIISTRRGRFIFKDVVLRNGMTHQRWFYHSHFQIPTPAGGEWRIFQIPKRLRWGDGYSPLENEGNSSPSKKGDHFTRIIFQSQHHFKRKRIILQFQHFSRDILVFKGVRSKWSLACNVKDF